MKNRFLPFLIPLLLLAGCQPLRAPEWRTVPAQNPSGTVNVLVEIPAGSVEKWEMNKKSGQLAPDSIDGKPRRIQYLPYPANYGMIPQTLLPKKAGGDGDPLDVILLGEAAERGSLIESRVIGVLKLQDSGEQDDKLIAVDINSTFGTLQSLKALETSFPGVTDILRHWFTNYKGAGKMTSEGYQDENAARQLLQKAIEAYP